MCTVYMCSGHAVAASPSCLFSAPPGGEVWEADMEETGGGCGGPRGGSNLALAQTIAREHPGGLP